MEFEGVILISKAIVHILKPKDNYRKLSDYEIETDARLDNLIIKHINNSIKNDTRRYAKFNSGTNTTKDSSILILEDESNFIEESKKIAIALFGAMRGTNASPANFLIAKYSHGSQKAIALLKLDFNDNFYTEEVTKDDGTMKIEVRVKDAGFYEKQKLQKCAFIYEDILTDEDALIVILDKQAKDDVSNYFGNTFLNSSLFIDDRANTKNMIDEIQNFINTKYDNEAKMLVETTYSLTSYFKSQEIFEIDDMLNKVFDNDEIKQEFKERIKDKLIDFSFTIDLKKAELKFNSRHITTSNGIMLKAQASLFNSNNIDVGPEDIDGLVDITIKKVKIIENK